MLPRTRPAFVLGSLLLVVAAFVYSTSQAQQSGQQPAPTPQPPTIRLDSDAQVVTLCPESESVANPRVRLKATGFSPDGDPLRYRWAVSGGRLDTTEGTDVVWDLTAAYVQPKYEVRLNVYNVGDKRYYIGGYNNSPNRVLPGAPLSASLTFRYNFL